VTDGARLLDRSDDDDVADGAKSIRKGYDPLRSIAIVIGDENDWHAVSRL
jgi:hypothetical protein